MAARSPAPPISRSALRQIPVPVLITHHTVFVIPVPCTAAIPLLLPRTVIVAPRLASRPPAPDMLACEHTPPAALPIKHPRETINRIPVRSSNSHRKRRTHPDSDDEYIPDENIPEQSTPSRNAYKPTTRTPKRQQRQPPKDGRFDDFLGEISLMKAKTQEASPLITIFELPIEVRKKIYRNFLVTSTAKIIFPGKSSCNTFEQMNPDLHTKILCANSQFYKDCRSVLYGDNNFIAEDPADFFQPVGIDRLRASTAAKIKHISIVRKGGVKKCDIDGEYLASSLHNMCLKSPAFLGLKTITIQLELARPTHLNFFTLQMYLNDRGADADVRAMYKKEPMLQRTAAKVAFAAFMKGAPFQGLIRNASSNDDYDKDQTVDVTGVRLFRSKAPQEEYKEEEGYLDKTILNTLADEVAFEVPGGLRRFRQYQKSVEM